MIERVDPLATGQEAAVSEQAASEWLWDRARRCVRHEEQAYGKRVAEVYDALSRHGFATVAELAPELLGTSHEIRAKLDQLRRMGLVYYDRPEWHVA